MIFLEKQGYLFLLLIDTPVGISLSEPLIQM